MGMADGKRESLGPSDWTEAALNALAAGGLAAVAVEPLAKSLGTTKGSFYWHFADRNALLEATLELWERRDTERVVADLDQTLDAVSRLRTLMHLTFASVGAGVAGHGGTVELALQASASHPKVAATLQRVTRRRLEVVTRLYVELGLSPTRARQRALLAYTSYLGHAQVAHATPELLPHGRGLTNHVTQVVDILLDTSH